MTNTPPSQPANPVKLDRYGYNAIARHMSQAVITAILVFLGARTLNWGWGWVFAVVYTLCWAGLNLALARWNPEMLNERGKRVQQHTGTKLWDWIILGMYFTLLLVQPYLAGHDYHYMLSGDSGTGVHVIGNLLMILSFVILTWAMVSNRFFEGTVRIQTQRNHSVVTSGPYRYVRHPGYTAVVLNFFALPVALVAWSAMIPGLLGIALYVVRTVLEDRTLQAELPGYADYAEQVPYRLLPGVW